MTPLLVSFARAGYSAYFRNAAREFGIDVTLMIEQIKLSTAERARRMHALAQTAESVRGTARKSKHEL